MLFNQYGNSKMFEMKFYTRNRYTMTYETRVGINQIFTRQTNKNLSVTLLIN